MGSGTDLQSSAKCLLVDATRYITSGERKRAHDTLIKVLEGIKHSRSDRLLLYLSTRTIKQATTDSSLAGVVQECGRLFNSLMCFDKALSCFELATDLTSPLYGSTESVGYAGALEASIQTHLLLAETDEACQLIDKINLQKHPHAKYVVGSYLLEITQTLINEGKYKAALSKLTHSAWTCSTPGRVSSYAERCLEAERYSLLAYVRYKDSSSTGNGTQRTAQELFSEVCRLWEHLKWPLDHSESIANALARCAIERIEHGHYGAENPVMKTMLHLNENVWRHCGEVSFTVGRNMYDVAQAAEKIEKHMKSAQYGEKTVAIFKHCPTYLKERTMFIGASLYLVGLNYFKENKLDLAMKNIEECIPLLEKSSPKEDSIHYLFAMKTLAQAYGDMAHALKIQSGAIDKSLEYSQKALANRKFLTHSAIKTAQAIRADSLHCRGAYMKHQGKLNEAEAIYTEADEMFAETVSDCSNSFEFIAYGYFLYRREYYTKAAKMLQLGYEFAKTGFPSLMFTHDEWHTLTEEMKFEVQHSEKKSFDVPNRVVALYFHIMALLGSGIEKTHKNVVQSVREMKKVVNTYDYISCGQKGKMPACKYRCSSLSLLGYAYRTLGRHREAAKSFRKAYNSFATESARLNMVQDTIEANKFDEDDFSDSSSDGLDDVGL